MKVQTACRIRLWYGIFLGVFTIVLAAVFIAGAADIYFADPDGEPYSYALVGEKLKNVLIPVILYAVAVVAGYVISVILPAAGRKKGKPDARAALARLEKRIPECSDEGFAAEEKNYKKFKAIRVAVWSVCAAFAVAASGVTIAYLADRAHFPAENVNAEIIAMLRAVLPWMISAFALFAAAVIYEAFAVKRELASVKKLIALGKGSPAASVSAAGAGARAVWIARLCVFAVAVAFIIAGIVNGGMGDVLMKAVKICTECIGLG